jgi:hypothetical protein
MVGSGEHSVSVSRFGRDLSFVGEYAECSLDCLACHVVLKAQLADAGKQISLGKTLRPDVIAKFGQNEA